MIVTSRPVRPAASTSPLSPSSSSSPAHTARKASANADPERSSCSAGDAQAKVVDPDRLRARRPDLVRPLIDDLGAHVLERRQHVGQQHTVGAQQLAAADLLALAERPVERQDRAAAPFELADPVDVDDRTRRAPVGPVGGRKRLAEARDTARTACCSPCAAISAARRSSLQARVSSAIRASIAATSKSGRPVRAAHDVVDAHDHRLGQLQAPVELAAAERLGDDRRGPAAIDRVEAVPRQAQRAGDEPIELVTRDEQPHALALAQARGSRSPSRTGPRSRSGSAGRAEASRGCRSSPSRRGCWAGTPPAPGRARPSRAAAGSRADSTCRPRSCTGPRNRRSPITVPSGANRLTPT